MSRFHNRNFELLEPYDAKVSCTVLRGERGSNAPDLPDQTAEHCSSLNINEKYQNETNRIILEHIVLLYLYTFV